MDISKTNFGKRVVDELYIHISAAECIDRDEHRVALQHALRRIPAVNGLAPNVAKLNLKTGRLSLLAYSDFETDPFPRLLASWSFAAGFATPPIYRTYENSLNPPILHRKELLVPTSYPGRDQWAQLTATAEALGLFDDTRTIGFLQNWDRLIGSKGYRLVGAEFQPLGNETQPFEGCTLGAKSGPIQRHLTALTRTNLSAPVQLLLRHGLLESSLSFFDYGCGRGGDVAALAGNGFDARGWDPHFAPDHAIGKADTVNLGFVVNVIEDPAERVEALHKAFALARQVMSIGVMLYTGDLPGKPFQDGYITSRNTFQKYFSQGELKDYIEQVLHQEAFMVGPGIAFVFADKGREQAFNSARFRSKGIASRLLAIRIPNDRLSRKRKERTATTPRLTQAAIRLTSSRALLDSLWTTTLELGRLPEPQEIDNLEEIESKIGSFRRAVRLLKLHYDNDLLVAAGRTRSDDLRLYLAVQQFAKRPAYRELQPRLQLDIKAFFGDYRSAQAAGVRLLLDAADPSQLLAACERSASEGLGWLEDDHSLQLHIALVERLPAVLRAYVACGLILWDAISEVQLVKIHIESGKLTLLEFDDFDANPLPQLRRRIKVNVRRQDYDLFEYGTPEYPKPILYRKSRYLHEDYPGYAEQLSFDESIENTGVLGASEFGPPPERLHEFLELQRLAVQGMHLVSSEQIPELDQKCGKYLTFRSFIKCGETQYRLGIVNRPLNPATYNAIYELATQILDPVIEYFGSIRLTYGFCSTELGKNIRARVAPKLDQHAACEVGRNGKPICDRGGAACDFYVEDENMQEVAIWIVANLPFDRLYFYGSDHPVHVSYSPSHSRNAFQMVKSKTGHLIPRQFFT